MESTIKAKVVAAIISSKITTNKVANGNFSNLISGAEIDLTNLKQDLSNLGDFLHYPEVERRKLVKGEWTVDNKPSTRAQLCPISGEEIMPIGSTKSAITSIGESEAVAWPFNSLLRCSETTIDGVSYGKEQTPIVDFLKLLAGKKWKCESTFDGVPSRGTTPRAYEIVSIQ